MFVFIELFNVTKYTLDVLYYNHPLCHRGYICYELVENRRLP